MQKIWSKRKKFRQANGYSQEKLAELTGLHRTYISSVEGDKKYITKQY